MDWFTVLLMIAAFGTFGCFIYLGILLWNEISLTLKEVEKTKTPILRLIAEIQAMQPLVQSLSENANHRAAELQEVVELSKATSAQVGMLVAAAGSLRSPNVQLALRYGKNWIKDRRANPLVRDLKGIARRIRKYLR